MNLQSPRPKNEMQQAIRSAWPDIVYGKPPTSRQELDLDTADGAWCMVQEHCGDHPSLSAAIESMAPKLRALTIKVHAQWG